MQLISSTVPKCNSLKAASLPDVMAHIYVSHTTDTLMYVDPFQNTGLSQGQLGRFAGEDDGDVDQL